MEEWNKLIFYLLLYIGIIVLFVWFAKRGSKVNYHKSSIQMNPGQELEVKHMSEVKQFILLLCSSVLLIIAATKLKQQNVQYQHLYNQMFEWHQKNEKNQKLFESFYNQHWEFINQMILRK